jgi:hypothetical protein
MNNMILAWSKNGELLISESVKLGEPVCVSMDYAYLFKFSSTTLEMIDQYHYIPLSYEGDLAIAS